MTMSEMLIAATGILLCAAMLAVMLRVQKPELALCLSLGAGALVLFLLLQQLTPLLATMRRMLSMADFPSEYFGVVLKAAGVCMLTQLTADTCRDAGEKASCPKSNGLLFMFPARQAALCPEQISCHCSCIIAAL